LDWTVRGELDWIVMKALEKDRRRRYETANDLAADMMRYLTDQPVEACPPSARYRLAKFARRNRAGLLTATLLATAVVTGAAASAWQAVRATQAEAKAGARAEEARLVLDYLVEDVFGAARPEKTRGRTLTVQELLARGEEAIPARFSRRPLVEASARQAMGRCSCPSAGSRKRSGSFVARRRSGPRSSAPSTPTRSRRRVSSSTHFRKSTTSDTRPDPRSSRWPAACSRSAGAFSGRSIPRRCSR